MIQSKSLLNNAGVLKKHAFKIILLSITVSILTPKSIDGKDITLILRHRTLISTLASKYYSSVYFDVLIKKYNYISEDYSDPGDTVVIPDIDTLFLKSKFFSVFEEEVKLIEKARQFQTTMYQYKTDIERIGIDSISKKGKKGAVLINKAICMIKAKSDSLKLPYPEKVISQLHSTAADMSQYNNYLRGSDIYASKNIFTGNQHMSLWRMYAVLWQMQ